MLRWLNEENLNSIKRNAQMNNSVIFTGSFYDGLKGKRKAVESIKKKMQTTKST